MENMKKQPGKSSEKIADKNGRKQRLENREKKNEGKTGTKNGGENKEENSQGESNWGGEKMREIRGLNPCQTEATIQPSRFASIFVAACHLLGFFLDGRNTHDWF